MSERREEWVKTINPCSAAYLLKLLSAKGFHLPEKCLVEDSVSSARELNTEAQSLEGDEFAKICQTYLFDRAIVPAAIVSRDSFVKVNDAFLELLDYTREEWEALPSHQFSEFMVTNELTQKRLTITEALKWFILKACKERKMEVPAVIDELFRTCFKENEPSSRERLSVVEDEVAREMEKAASSSHVICGLVNTYKTKRGEEQIAWYTQSVTGTSYLITQPQKVTDLYMLASQLVLESETAKARLDLVNKMTDARLRKLIASDRVDLQKNPALAFTYPDTAIMFADIVGFSTITTKYSGRPELIFEKVGELYRRFNEIRRKYETVEFHKYIGDCVMALGFKNAEKDEHLIELVYFATAVQESLRKDPIK